jgi:hypothetical protein
MNQTLHSFIKYCVPSLPGENRIYNGNTRENKINVDPIIMRFIVNQRKLLMLYITMGNNRIYKRKLEVR